MSESYLAMNPRSKKAINAPDYELPTDNKTLFFDFYMAQALMMSPQTSHYPGNAEDLEVMDTSLRKEIMPRVYDALHAMVEEYLFGSIASESRYFARNSVLFSYPEELNSNPKTQEYIEKAKRLSGGDTGSGLVERKQVALEVFPNRREFVEFALPFFMEGKWSGGYGGKAWGQICEGWLELNKAPRGGTEAQKLAMDHVFDLCHNNGSALNKFPEWSKWLLPAMDYRRYSLEPWDLFHLSSSSMQRFAAKYLKVFGYGSYEDYLSNVPYARGGNVPSEEEWGQFEQDRRDKNKILTDRAQGKNPTNDPGYNPRMRGDLGELEKIMPKNKVLEGRKIDPSKISLPGIKDWTADDLIHNPEHKKITYLISGKTLKVGDKFKGLDNDKSLGQVVRLWRNGTNEGGDWVSGIWLSGTWNSGNWHNGIFVSGTWKDGTWERGYWLKGDWQGGDWKGGWVLDDEKSGKMISEVESKNSSNTEEEDEKKKGSWTTVGGKNFIWLPEGFNPASYFSGNAEEKYLETAK